MSPYEVQGHPPGAIRSRAERGPRSSPRRRRMSWRGRLAATVAWVALGVRLLADAAPSLWPAVAARIHTGTCAGGRLNFAASPFGLTLSGGTELRLTFEYIGLLASLLALAAMVGGGWAWHMERRPLVAFSAAGLAGGVLFWGTPWVAIPVGLGLVVFGLLTWTARR